MENPKAKALCEILSVYCKNSIVSTFSEQLDKPAFNGFVTSKTSTIEKAFLEKGIVQKSKFDKCYFYFDKEKEPMGSSLLHHAGFFYILDASSAYMTERLRSIVGENALALDMCAAPGGKSISLKIRRPDIDIVANDIAIDRAKEMNRNIERIGLDIKTMALDPLSLDLVEAFDLVILDTPCSGSGMIRKERKMLEDWSQKKVDRLLPIQEQLLEKAYSLLAKGGILAYSTCSLSYEEDDGQIKAFLNRHKDIKEVQVPVEKSVVRKDYGYHLLPGIFKGEGIYFCFLKKEGTPTKEREEAKTREKSPVDGYRLYKTKTNGYLTKHLPLSTSRLPFLRPGIPLYDTSEHPKCPYDHGYAKIATEFERIPLTKEAAIRYYAGEEIPTDYQGKDGLYILSYLDVPLGFSKKVGRRLKNYLPKGLRAKVH